MSVLALMLCAVKGIGPSCSLHPWMGPTLSRTGLAQPYPQTRQALRDAKLMLGLMKSETKINTYC